MSYKCCVENWCIKNCDDLHHECICFLCRNDDICFAVKHKCSCFKDFEKCLAVDIIVSVMKILKNVKVKKMNLVY